MSSELIKVVCQGPASRDASPAPTCEGSSPAIRDLCTHPNDWHAPNPPRQAAYHSVVAPFCGDCRRGAMLICIDTERSRIVGQLVARGVPHDVAEDAVSQMSKAVAKPTFEPPFLTPDRVFLYLAGAARLNARGIQNPRSIVARNSRGLDSPALGNEADLATAPHARSWSESLEAFELRFDIARIFHFASSHDQECIAARILIDAGVSNEELRDDDATLRLLHGPLGHNLAHLFGAEFVRIARAIYATSGRIRSAGAVSNRAVRGALILASVFGRSPKPPVRRPRS